MMQMVRGRRGNDREYSLNMVGERGRKSRTQEGEEAGEMGGWEDELEDDKRQRATATG